MGLVLLIFWAQLFIILTLTFSGSGNLITLLIYIEILIFSLVLILNSLSFLFDDLLGTFTSLLLLPIAGCESAIGLLIVYQYYNVTGTSRI